MMPATNPPKQVSSSSSSICLTMTSSPEKVPETPTTTRENFGFHARVLIKSGTRLNGRGDPHPCCDVVSKIAARINVFWLFPARGGRANPRKRNATALMVRAQNEFFC